jgi:hypothetical protein
MTETQKLVWICKIRCDFIVLCRMVQVYHIITRVQSRNQLQCFSSSLHYYAAYRNDSLREDGLSGQNARVRGNKQHGRLIKKNNMTPDSKRGYASRITIEYQQFHQITKFSRKIRPTDSQSSPVVCWNNRQKHRVFMYSYWTLEICIL